MTKRSQKVELLAPAGSPEKLKYALHYGADAVYAGIPDVSMRARINSFTEKSLAEAIIYAHSHGKKIYVTLNIYAHNYHLPAIEKHLKFLAKAKPDAVIAADPGIIALVKKHLPKTPIHLSTQANTTNWQAAKFWYDLGIRRIVLARETTLADIKEIHKKVPKLELEYFVHGAMCMSYSGRCILSKWMSGKSANLGDCTQPCRWSYSLKSPIAPVSLTAELEEKQSGRGMELEQDSHGTYFFNSKDLNLLEHLEELKKAGVTSFKIEGRNKSVFYVSSVCRAYRSVLGAIEAKNTARSLGKIKKNAAQELAKLVNRGYTKGFLLGNEPEHAFSGQNTDNAHQFVGEVLKSSGKKLKVKVHNVLRTGDKLEAVTKEKNIAVKVVRILNEEGDEVASAHGGHEKPYYIEVNKNGIGSMSLLRKTINN